MYLYDGFRALATFTRFPTLEFRIKEITWPEIDGGGPIDTTVMHNMTLRTNAPKALLSIGMIKMTVQYDPGVWASILTAALNATGLRAAGQGINTVGVINVPTDMTLTAPDTATLVINVFINKFTPAPFKEGEFPTADVEIIPTNVTGAVVTGQGAHDALPTFTTGFAANNVMM